MSATVMRDGNCGFTLLEVLLAMTIAAGVFTALYQSFEAVFDVYERSSGRGTNAQGVRMALTQLQKDLLCLVERPTLSSEVDPESVAGLTIRPVADIAEGERYEALSFFSQSNLRLGRAFTLGEVRSLSYEVERNENGLMSMWRVSRSPECVGMDEECPDERRVLVLRGIRNMRIFGVGTGGDTYEEWETGSDNENIFPSAVRISVNSGRQWVEEIPLGSLSPVKVEE